MQQTKQVFQCKDCEAIITSHEDKQDKCNFCGKSNLILLATKTPKWTEEDYIECKAKLNEYYWKVVQQLNKYIDIPEKQAKFIALWIVSTYFHESFVSFPYLFFNAMRGSGKTRTLKLISSLGSKGDGSVQNNLTEAVLFRIPRGTTTCIDEVEQIGNKEKQTLRELLNSAYKKGMKVKRMKKVTGKGEEKMVAEVYEPYFPICMANINGVEEVLADRSIVIILEKSNDPGKTKLIEDFDSNIDILDIKRTLSVVSVVSADVVMKKRYLEKWNDYICYKYNNTNYTNNTTTLTTLTTQDLELESFFNKIDNLGITGRNFELLLPLLLIAKQIGDDVFEDSLKIGLEIVNEKKEEEYQDTKDVSLYEFCCSDIIVDKGISFIPVKEFTYLFRTWIGDTDDKDDRWLNEKWIGRALKRLNLVLDKRRVASGNMVTIDIAKASEKLKLFKQDKKEVKDNV